MEIFDQNLEWSKGANYVVILEGGVAGQVAGGSGEGEILGIAPEEWQ